MGGRSGAQAGAAQLGLGRVTPASTAPMGVSGDVGKQADRADRVDPVRGTGGHARGAGVCQSGVWALRTGVGCNAGAVYSNLGVEANPAT